MFVPSITKVTRFLLGFLFLLSAAEHVLAQRQLLCDTTCGPDPNQTTPTFYDDAVAARPKIMNQRRGGGAVIAIKRMPFVQTILGSQSYDYSINLISLSGRNNLNLDLALTYNSRVWSRTPDGIIFNADIDNPSPGFRGLDFGFIQWNAVNSDWILTGPNGNKNELVLAGAALYQSQDSTYIQFNSSNNVVVYRDGTQVFYEQFGTTPFSATSPLRPTKVENSNGNTISITYVNTASLSINSITDSVGRTINFSYDASGRLISISQGTKTITFSWNTAYVLSYQFSIPVIASPANGSTQAVLSSVTLPDHTSVNFLYGDWGIVNRIERRSTNGSLRSYVSYNFPASAAGVLGDAPAFTQQTVFDGINTSVWTYSVAANTSGLVTSSAITDPLGTTTTTTFSSAGDWKDGLPINEQIKDATGKIWRTRTKTWTSDTGTSAVNPHLSSVVTQLDDGTQSKASYSYDANGNVTDLQETDFGSGAPGALLRETVTTYANLGNHVLNRPSQILVKNAGGVVSRADFAYDEYSSYPLQPVSPAAVQHDDANYSTTPTNARGNLTTKIIYTNAAQGTGAIKSIFKYDVLGNRVSAQEGCCTQANSVYSVATQYAFPDSVSTGPAGSQLTTSFTYNLNSGTVASTTDANGQATTYAYDVDNRITQRQTPDGVINTTVYDDANASPGFTSSTTADSRQITVTNDANGHELAAKLLNGTTLVSTVSSTYDALGRITAASNAYGPSDTPVYTTYAYDALGRSIQHTPPALTPGVSQNGFQTSYSGHTSIFTDPAGRQRKEYHNALGELVEVDEPGAPFSGTQASGSITINGSLNSKPTIAAASGSGSVTISGTEGTNVTCVRTFNGGLNCTTHYDTGSVSVTVTIGGTAITKTSFYGQGSNAQNLATALANQFSQDANFKNISIVQNSTTSYTINITAAAVGSATNYSYSATYGPRTDFTAATGGANFTGGVDGQTGATDSGTIALTVGNFTTAAVCYGPSCNSTTAQVATALGQALGASGSPVHNVQVSGSTISMTANQSSAAWNVPVTATPQTSDPSDFPSGSFASAGSLQGGADPYPSGLAHPFVTQYAYDTLGDLLQINQGQQIRTFAYDSLGRMTSMTVPEKANHSIAITYTDFGAVSTRTDARGIVTTYGYDSQDHLASIQYSDGTPSVTYSYGSAGAPNFSAGRLANATDGAGSETYQYDSMGRVIKCIRIIGGNTYTTTYTYTSDARIATITYPSGRVVTNQYDGIGRLAQVGTGGSSVININSYNAAGQILSALYGNGIQASYTYNNQLQVASILIGSASPVMNLSYNWGGANDDGLLMGVTDNLTAARSTSYTYDQLKRLTTAQTVDLTSPGTWQLQFAYDQYGNRLSQTPTGGTATIPSSSVTVDPATNRIATATYDLDGNVTNDGVNTYTFDAESRITHVNGTANTYAYDGAGKRVNRNGNYYIYSGGQVIAEYAGGAPAASPATEYIYARNKRVATIAAGTTTYPYWDHLSIRANANSAGTVTRTFGHYPFGETWYETGTHDKWDYTTYENDAESGLNYAMARFHSPRLGRFMSLDPWPADKHHPQTWNRYAYGNNNPLSVSDPTGMVECGDEDGSCDEGGGGGDDGGDPAVEQGPDDSSGGGGDSTGDSGNGNDGSSGDQGNSGNDCNGPAPPVPCSNAGQDNSGNNQDQNASSDSQGDCLYAEVPCANAGQNNDDTDLSKLDLYTERFDFYYVYMDDATAQYVNGLGNMMNDPRFYMCWVGAAAFVGSGGPAIVDGLMEIPPGADLLESGGPIWNAIKGAKGQIGAAAGTCGLAHLD